MTRPDIDLRNVDARDALKQEEVMEKMKRKQRAWKEKMVQTEDTKLVRWHTLEKLQGKDTVKETEEETESQFFETQHV